MGATLMPPLGFTDQELERLASAAAMLPQHARDKFLRSVANLLGGTNSDIPPAALESAISFVLANYGISCAPRSKRQRRREQLLRLVRQN